MSTALAGQEASLASVPAQNVRQNWVLTPLQDTMFVIAAPLIALVLALLAFRRYGAAEAASLIVVTHIVMTVAHHLPTFIRIYGDADLFRRFKWNFVLGPVIPLSISTAVLVYLYVNDLPVEYFLYLYIMLVLWDPWHFLRQHYGFMRIYDRPNAAPKVLASRMDLALSVVWFAYAMLASGAWLPELLQDLYSSASIPAALALSVDVLQAAAGVLRAAAIAMSVLYAVYLGWCWKHGYFVSGAKIALLLVTFGVMYVAYVPNAWIQSVAPGWSFKVGFAVIGVVHMTQYLAIVWRYNRSLAGNAERSRAGWFRRWHAKGGVLIGAAYVGVCLLYGEVVTTQWDNRLLMSVMLALGFTSTLLHYYFDGFIWKVRHLQNREALAMHTSGLREPVTGSNGGTSWWSSSAPIAVGRMFKRQLLYFGLPMTLLTVGALAAWDAPDGNYVRHMYAAQSLSQQGLQQAAATEARAAYAAMNKQLPFTAKMAELDATAARQAELAFLIYNQSLYEHIVMPQLGRQPLDASHVGAHRERIGEAVRWLSSALQTGGSIAHVGREKLSADDARSVLESWRRQIG